MAFFDIKITYIREGDRDTTTDSGSSSNDYVKLVEEEFKSPTDSSFIDWYMETYGDSSDQLWENMFAAAEEYRSYACTDGIFEAKIRAYLSSPSLNYKMSASRGDFTEDSPEKMTETVKDTVYIDNESTYTFTGEYIPEFEYIDWEGKVFDSENSLLPVNPPINVSFVDTGNTEDRIVILDFGQKCNGTIRFAYESQYELWLLEIPPREESDIKETTTDTGEVEEDTKDSFSSNVTAMWDSETDTISITVPEEMGDSCTGNGGNTVDDDDDEETGCYDLHVVRDKCTNEVLSEELVEVGCPDNGSESGEEEEDG